jgi:uncharacterized alkaline shock family protein YloU
VSTGIETAAPAEGREAASRGRLVLEKKVVERVASEAASECGETGGTSGGVLGFGSHGDLTARAAASVELVGQSATVALDLTVAYPIPIRQATDQVRDHVMARVRELTGVQVSRVDITVTALHRPASTVAAVQ